MLYYTVPNDELCLTCYVGVFLSSLKKKTFVRVNSKSLEQAQRLSLNYVLNNKPFQQPSITLGSQSIEASTKITSCNAFSTAKSKCSTSNIARRNIAVRMTTAARTSGTNSINKILTPIVGKTVNDGCIKKTMSTLLGF